MSNSSVGGVPTSGLGVAAAVKLTGTGVVQTYTPVAGTRGVAQYTVNIPIGTSVAVTSSAIDDAGAAVGSSSVGGLELGSAANYAILAAAGITNTGLTVISGGNVGSYPTTSITPGTPPWTLVPPAVIDNADAQAALAAALIAYNFYTNAAYPTTQTLTTADIGSSGIQGSAGAPAGTWYAGKYVSPSSIAMTTPITLDAQNNPNAVFVFYATASTITQAIASTVTLVNGAKASNVFWIAGSSYTSTTGAVVAVGNILANTSITIGGGTLSGRALAGIVTSSGAVTISSAVAITVPAQSAQTGWNAIVYNSVPQSSNPAWYRPSNAGKYSNAFFAPVSVDDTDANPWTVRGRVAGQCVVEFQIPTFLNTNGSLLTDVNTVMDETPIDSISAELIVTVTGGTS
jgi:Ice-binding-like